MNLDKPCGLMGCLHMCPWLSCHARPCEVMEVQCIAQTTIQNTKPFADNQSQHTPFQQKPNPETQMFPPHAKARFEFSNSETPSEKHGFKNHKCDKHRSWCPPQSSQFGTLCKYSKPGFWGSVVLVVVWWWAGWVSKIQIKQKIMFHFCEHCWRQMLFWGGGIVFCCCFWVGEVVGNIPDQARQSFFNYCL